MRRAIWLVALLLLAVGAQAQTDFIKYTPAPVAGTSGGGATFTAPVLLPDGTVTAPSLAFSSEPQLGFFRSGATVLGLGIGGSNWAIHGSTGIFLRNSGAFGWSSGQPTINSPDLFLYRDAA